MSARPHVTKALQYARGVGAGKILACKWVKLACQRHLDDAKAALRKDYPFRFDAELAEWACALAEQFPHIKGHWAIPQAGVSPRIQLEPFQCFERAMLFGWVEKATGLRRFRTAYIERPRKNAKSTDAAITGLTCFAADQEYGAEVYSGATSEKQAWEVFGPARLMALRTPAFCEEYGISVNAKSLTILDSGSKFEPIIGKPGDGASPSLSITDEYHEHPDSVQFDTMVTGMGARTQPLALVITTAGDSLDSPCYALHEQAQKVLDGSLPNERLFGIIYTVDEGDDWTSEDALRKANPNFGVSVSSDFLRQQQIEAINDSRKQAVFKTKHLDIWCQARSPWMNMEWWLRQGDAGLKAEQFIGERCAMAFDLANRLDLVSQARLFSRAIDGETHYYYFGRHYAPAAAIDEPDKTDYRGWAADGYLIRTEGNDCDLDRLLEDAAGDRKMFQVILATVDPYNSIGISQGLQKLGLKVTDTPQTVGEFSEAMKTVEAAVKDGRFHHDGNPCMNWMVGNVSVKPDARDNVFPRKDARARKIDGPVALFMAMKVLMTGPKPSVYESREALTV